MDQLTVDLSKLKPATKIAASGPQCGLWQPCRSYDSTFHSSDYRVGSGRTIDENVEKKGCMEPQRPRIEIYSPRFGLPTE